MEGIIAIGTVCLVDQYGSDHLYRAESKASATVRQSAHLVDVLVINCDDLRCIGVRTRTYRVTFTSDHGSFIINIDGKRFPPTKTKRHGEDIEN